MDSESHRRIAKRGVPRKNKQCPRGPTISFCFPVEGVDIKMIVKLGFEKDGICWRGTEGAGLRVRVEVDEGLPRVLEEEIVPSYVDLHKQSNDLL